MLMMFVELDVLISILVVSVYIEGFICIFIFFEGG